MEKKYVWYAFWDCEIDRKHIKLALDKKMNVKSAYNGEVFKVIGTAEQLARLLEVSEGEIVQLSHLAMSTIREY